MAAEIFVRCRQDSGSALEYVHAFRLDTKAQCVGTKHFENMYAAQCETVRRTYGIGDRKPQHKISTGTERGLGSQLRRKKRGHPALRETGADDTDDLISL